MRRRYARPRHFEQPNNAVDGYDPFSLIAVGHYMHELNAGTFAFNAPTGDVLAVTGRDLECFETIARR